MTPTMRYLTPVNAEQLWQTGESERARRSVALASHTHGFQKPHPHAHTKIHGGYHHHQHWAKHHWSHWKHCWRELGRMCRKVDEGGRVRSECLQGLQSVQFGWKGVVRMCSLFYSPKAVVRSVEAITACWLWLSPHTKNAKNEICSVASPRQSTKRRACIRKQVIILLATFPSLPLFSNCVRVQFNLT